jgi:hypothetical protein
LQQGQPSQIKGNGTIVTRATTPYWQWQGRLCIDNGNNTIIMRVIKGKDTYALMAIMPLQQGQQHHCNDGGDACASMILTMPLQWGQQRQLEDDNSTIAMRATRPLQIKGNNAIVTRATMPAWQWQGCLHIDNSINAIVMRATIAIAKMVKMHAHQRQQCHCNESNNAITMMARTPAHQWWQQCHCNDGNDTNLRTVTMPLQ